MNKKVLPAIYSAAVWCLFVVLLFFWLYCVTTVTPFTERSLLACRRLLFPLLHAEKEIGDVCTQAKRSEPLTVSQPSLRSMKGVTVELNKPSPQNKIKISKKR